MHQPIPEPTESGETGSPTDSGTKATGSTGTPPPPVDGWTLELRPQIVGSEASTDEFTADLEQFLSFNDGDSVASVESTDGTAAIDGLMPKASVLGMLAWLSAPTMQPTATLVLPVDYADLQGGDTHAPPAFVLPQGLVDELLAELENEFGIVPKGKGGFVFGTVVDETGAPIDGAQVLITNKKGKATDSQVFYVDSDNNDGYFTSGSDTNEQTDAKSPFGPAGWVVPVGPVLNVTGLAEGYKFSEAGTRLTLTATAVARGVIFVRIVGTRI